MASPLPVEPREPTESQQLLALSFYKAQTERLMVLNQFLATPVKAPLDAEGNCDPDVVAAYNVAVETSLKHVRQLILNDSPRQD